jgi:hypothetical protein
VANGKVLGKVLDRTWIILFNKNVIVEYQHPSIDNLRSLLLDFVPVDFNNNLSKSYSRCFLDDNENNRSYDTTRWSWCTQYDHVLNKNTYESDRFDWDKLHFESNDSPNSLWTSILSSESFEHIDQLLRLQVDMNRCDTASYQDKCICFANFDWIHSIDRHFQWILTINNNHLRTIGCRRLLCDMYDDDMMIMIETWLELILFPYSIDETRISLFDDVFITWQTISIELLGICFVKQNHWIRIFEWFHFVDNSSVSSWQYFDYPWISMIRFVTCEHGKFHQSKYCQWTTTIVTRIWHERNSIVIIIDIRLEHVELSM